MKLTEYATKSLRLDQELRSTSRVIAYALDAWRHAGIMALLLLVMDLTAWSPFAANEPRTRLSFVALWALFMAVFNLWRFPAAEAPLDHPDRDAAT